MKSLIHTAAFILTSQSIATAQLTTEQTTEAIAVLCLDSGTLAACGLSSAQCIEVWNSLRSAETLWTEYTGISVGLREAINQGAEGGSEADGTHLARQQLLEHISEWHIETIAPLAPELRTRLAVQLLNKDLDAPPYLRAVEWPPETKTLIEQGTVQADREHRLAIEPSSTPAASALQTALAEPAVIAAKAEYEARIDMIRATWTQFVLSSPTE